MYEEYKLKRMGDEHALMEMGMHGDTACHNGWDYNHSEDAKDYKDVKPCQGEVVLNTVSDTVLFYILL